MDFIRNIIFIFVVISAITFTVPLGSTVVEHHTRQQFRDYWYPNGAEISRFSLKQSRYGEIHEGDAVLIYVTEDFRPDTQVKADFQKPNNVSVLKLNATKKFNTGIYPYSVMQSTFFPVDNNQHAIKVTSSMRWET